ncbi:unnamed protein product [Menidia menidia]|uniref:(Atlantic silverside) hypothetical protein n=1 Tax=Menidia menidia TaxID=238744 RepID=A0A8S4BCT8_9TELE|nr:unnamed protein product [Menidia menidia]
MKSCKEWRRRMRRRRRAGARGTAGSARVRQGGEQVEA